MSIPKSIRLIFKVLISFLLLVFFVRIGLDFWVNKRLNTLINKQPGQLHELTYRSIKVRLREGSVWLEGLRYKPIKSRVEKIVSEKNNPEIVMDLEVEKAELIGLNYWSLVKGKIKVNEIIIDQPELAVFILPEPLKKDSITKELRKSTDVLDGVQLEGFSILNAKGAIYKTDLIDTVSFGSMEQFNYQMSDVDYQQSDDKNVSNWVADVKMQVNNIVIPDAGGYLLKLDELELNFSENSLRLKNGMMKPLSSLGQFEKEHSYRKSRLSFNFNEVVLRDVNYSRILYQEWFAKELQVNGLDLSLYVNNQKPFPPNKKFHFIPTLLRTIPKPFALDSVQLNNCRFEYTIPGKDGEKRAQLHFDKINGFLKGFTNQTTSGEEKLMVLDATCAPQGKGFIHTHWKLLLNNKNDPFEVSVSGKHLNLPSFNSMVQRTTHIAINKGEIPELNLEMHGNTKGVQGSILYSLKDVDLTISRVRKDKRVKEDKFFSFMANKMMSRTHKEERKHQSEFQLKRPSNTSFFKLFWLGLQEGLKEGFIHNEASKKSRKLRRKNKV